MECEIPQKIADIIGRISLQMAMINVQDFIKPAGNMVAECVHFRLTFVAVQHVLIRQPALVRKSIFQFIAVIAGRSRWQNRLNAANLDFCQPLQSICYTFLFEDQLRIITHVLPFAPSTGTKMLTERFGTMF